MTVLKAPPPRSSSHSGGTNQNDSMNSFDSCSHSLFHCNQRWQVQGFFNQIKSKVDEKNFFSPDNYNSFPQDGSIDTIKQYHVYWFNVKLNICIFSYICLNRTWYKVYIYLLYIFIHICILLVIGVALGAWLRSTARCFSCQSVGVFSAHLLNSYK